VRIRLETPNWLLRVIKQSVNAVILPVLRRLDILNIKEAIAFVLRSTIITTLNVNEIINAIVRVVRWVVETIDTLGVTETVLQRIANWLATQLLVSERSKLFASFTRVPPCDYVVLLNRYHNQISYDPTPLWDGNVNTALTLLYDSSDLTKPFRIRFHWNNPQQITHVSVFVTNASSNARFILERWDGGTTYTVLKTNLVNNQKGWLTHTIPDDYKNNVTNLCIRAAGGADNFITIAEVRFYTAYNFLWQFGSEWCKIGEYAFALLNNVLCLQPRSVLNISETVTTSINYTGSIIQSLVSDVAAFVENLRLRIANYLKETVTVAEQINATLSGGGGGGGGLQWDYSVAYNQQGNPISLDLSPLQDDNTSTAVNIYYTPAVLSNMRRFVVGWNEPRWFYQINIHISGYTTGKQLIVTLRDSYGYSQTAVLNITQTGWTYVYPDYYEISNIKEVEFAPDTTIQGFIALSEVWFTEI